MENYIIIGIIVVIAGFGLSSTIKHFKGQSGCCGCSDYKPKKKKLKNVLDQKTFKVEGMQCEQCEDRVEEEINDIKGVAGKVNLKKGELCVPYAEEVTDEVIKARIERPGYKMTGMEGK